MSAHQVPLYLLLPWRQLDQQRCEDEQRHGESASTRSRAPPSHPQAYVSSDPLLNLISYLLHFGFAISCLICDSFSVLARVSCQLWHW
jgi:hypothetical protein